MSSNKLNPSTNLGSNLAKLTNGEFVSQNQQNLTFNESGENITDLSFLTSKKHWEQDENQRFNLKKLNKSFRESVPVLEFIDWKITSVERGKVETVLPLNANSSNQYITHQAALILLSADYTGGLAVASLFHKAPIIGFWESINGYGVYMWGAQAKIKWHYPSTNDLTCKASIPEKDWAMLANRMFSSKKIVFTVKVEMFNGSRLVSECDFTYWAQDIYSLRKNAYDNSKIAVLYEHKIKTTAKLIAGLRALEDKNAPEDQRFHDPFAYHLAGKHGLTLADRFAKLIPQIQNMVSCRTKHLDDVVLKFVKEHKIANIVNIGSGYDSRFWRLGIENVNVYDMDLPIMLADRVKLLDYSSKKNITAIPIDLINQRVDEVLSEEQYKFDFSIPTLFIWEGGSMYFAQPEFGNIFSGISAIMKKGSQLWFDYVSADIINGSTGIQEIEDFMYNMAKMGESFIKGFNDIKELANEFNLRVISDEKSYTMAKSNDPHYKHYNFCVLEK